MASEKDVCSECEEHICNPCLLRDLLAERTSRIREILNTVDYSSFPRSAWDDVYEDVLDALYDIGKIVEE